MYIVLRDVVKTLRIFFSSFSYISLLYTGLVTILLYTLYFIFIYDDDVCFSSPISTYVVSFLFLYICFFMYAILISVSHMMP